MADEIGDELRLREAVDPRRLVLLLHVAGVHHGDPVRQRERLGLVVRHVDERDADLLLQVDELDLHLLAQLGIERRQRLVEQQHRRMRDERPRDGHALLLAAGQLVRIALAETREPNVGERFGDFRADLPARRLRHLERKRDVALDGHVRKERVALEHRAHRPVFGRPVGEILPVEQDAASIGQVEARDHAQERRLAASGRPEQREEFPRVDREAHAVDGSERAETARHVPDLEERHFGASSGSARHGQRRIV